MNMNVVAEKVVVFRDIIAAAAQWELAKIHIYKLLYQDSTIKIVAFKSLHICVIPIIDHQYIGISQKNVWLRGGSKNTSRFLIIII